MNFTTSIGTLEKLGTLQKSMVSHTERMDVVVGKKMDYGIFAGGRKGASRTTREQILTLSLMKVGDDLFEDVYIPKLAMYEILKEGDEVGIVLSEDGYRLLAVKNSTSDMKIVYGYHYQSAFKWLGIFLLIIGLLSLSFNIGIFQLAFIAASLALMLIGIKKNRTVHHNWLKALDFINWDDSETDLDPLPTPTPVYGLVEIFYNDNKLYSVSVDRAFGKNEFKDLHSDSQYFSNPQFRLFNVSDVWFIEHCGTATNQTILDGLKLDSPIALKEESIICVGNLNKGILKLPLTLRLKSI
jgi:hypothetical protein